MRIAIDARVLEKGITGIGRYLKDMLDGLEKAGGENEYFLFTCGEINYGGSFFKNIATGRAFLPDKIFSAYWLNMVLPGYLKRYRIDLFFTPNQLLPLKKTGVKNVITVHDAAHKKNKKYHSLIYRIYLELLLPRSLKLSDRVITVSESAGKDICEGYNISRDKVKVIYEYAAEKFKEIQIPDKDRIELVKKYNLPGKFVLYVGVIENRKNIKGIINTADILSQKAMGIKFVMVGRAGYGSAEVINEIKKRDYCSYLGPVDDETLIKLYNLAFAFIFPSYYEGFGLPPLEAMQTGTPVLTSNSSSLPEVVGEGGIMKDPDDAEGFASEIIRLADDDIYYKERKAEAIKQAKKFAGLNSAGELAKIFDELKN